MQIRNLCKFEPAGQTAHCIGFLAMMSDVLKALDLHKFNQMISFSTENALLM